MSLLQNSAHKFELDTDICVVCGHSATEIEDGLIPVECPGAPDKKFATDWTQKNMSRVSHTLDEIDDPVGCPSCGLIAGCCQNYPECPGNPEWKEGT